MSLVNLLLELPTELACDIVGKWLYLKELVCLDSAICQHTQRMILHRNVFQSPFCVIALALNIRDRKLLRNIIFRWFNEKKIRIGILNLPDGSILIELEKYLKNFGQYVRHVGLRYIVGVEPHLIQRYCPNLTSLVFTISPFQNGLISLLCSSSKLRSIKVHVVKDLSEAPLTSLDSCHLHLESIDLRCWEGNHEKSILKLCIPASVQRMRLTTSPNPPHWNQYLNLRSVGFVRVMSNEDFIALALVECPWIIHVDLSNNCACVSHVIASALNSIKQLHTLNIERRVFGTILEIAYFHRSSLTSLYLLHCTNISADQVNEVLEVCTQLRHFSVSCLFGVDCALLCNLTTLITIFINDDNVWRGVERNCIHLKHLYLILPVQDTVNSSKILLETARGLGALRNVCIVDSYHASRGNMVCGSLQAALPRVLVSRGDYGCWYNLFDLPI